MSREPPREPPPDPIDRTEPDRRTGRSVSGHPWSSGYAISPVDRSPIFYSITGDPRRAVDASDASAAVLSDGIGCDGYVWKYLRAELEPRYPVVHWHYRGHGRTPPPRRRDRVTIPDHAADLVAVLDECGVGPAVLLGHSMGVQVSLEAYRQHPGRVAALILVCGSFGHPLRTFHSSDRLETLLPRVRSLVKRAPWLFNRLERAILPTRLAYLLATLLEINGDLLEQKDFMPYLRGLSRIDAELFLDALCAANEHTARDLLPDIDVPVLIVAGDHDGFTPPWLGMQMHRAIPDSELVMVRNGSHTAPIERPDQVGAAVVDFLGRRLRGDRASTR